MSINGLTLDQLSYQQRETIKGLRAIGGSGKRRSIYEQSPMKEIRQVSRALARLEAYGFVDMNADQSWSITDSGKLLFDETKKSVGEMIVRAGEATTSEPQSPETPAIPEPETLSEPSEPEALNAQVVMQAEIKRWRQRMNPRFSTNDAAWLCQVLASELNDMPSISSLLEQMADYWRSVHEPTKHP